MHAVKISRRYQVTIPRPIREALSLQPGQTLDVSEVDGRIVLVPVPSSEEARGFLQGMDTRVVRDLDRV